MSEIRIDGIKTATSRRVSRRMIARALKHKRFILGIVLILVPFVWAIAAPVLAPGDPFDQDLSIAVLPPVWLEGGSWEYPLGTDFVGRDIYGRLIYGARVSLTVGLGGVLLAIVIGVTLGLIAGYYGGWSETIIMAVVDMLLSLPYLLLVVVVAGIWGSSLRNVILIFGVLDFPLFTRMTRGEVLSLRESGFVEAAHMVGASGWFILRHHIVPNLVGVIITVATFEIANMILLEAGLGFLGLSVPPTIPSWGNMLAEGRNYLASAWWLASFAGLAILCTTLGINLLGDWLRDTLDPRSR
jgi:ABC-type dipeptide/oligopeptide/nickel transport system permease subunit